MNELEVTLKALREVNRDIEGMLRSGVETKKLNDAREYRKMLEEDVLHAAKKAKTDKPAIAGVIIVKFI